MAGYAAEVVKTKHIGHAKSIMEELEQIPDVVVVAGGDGTSSEVVTGLLRRCENICPILFLPLGEKSETASNLLQNKMIDNSKIVKNLSQCMLALVQGHIIQRPVIKCELIGNSDSETCKPVFGILSFSWGILKDIDVDKERYWYLTVLKHSASVLFASLSNKLNQNILANIVSTPPCPGCNKCEVVVKNKLWLYVSKLLHPQSNTLSKNESRDYELCSTEKFYLLNAKQIDITCKQNSDFFFSLNADIIENIPSRYDFLVDMMKKNKIQYSTSLESRTIEVIPIQSEHQIYYIDGEGYDARHIKISVLPDALKYFS